MRPKPIQATPLQKTPILNRLLLPWSILQRLFLSLPSFPIALGRGQSFQLHYGHNILLAGQPISILLREIQPNPTFLATNHITLSSRNLLTLGREILGYREAGSERLTDHHHAYGAARSLSTYGALTGLHYKVVSSDEQCHNIGGCYRILSCLHPSNFWFTVCIPLGVFPHGKLQNH